MTKININEMTYNAVAEAITKRFATVYGDTAQFDSYQVVEGNYRGENVTMYRWNATVDGKQGTSGYIFQTSDNKYKVFNWYGSLEEYADSEYDTDLECLYDAVDFDDAFDYACEVWLKDIPAYRRSVK